MSKYKWDNLILFVEQLSSAAALQLPLDRTLQSMSQEAIDPKWRHAQENLSELVNLGSPLSDAMAKQPAYFPALLRRMVRAGEEGNVLPGMLASASRYLQNAREIQQRLRKSLIYPLFIWAILLIDFCIIVMFVVPKFVDMFQSMGAWLPGPTTSFLQYGIVFFIFGIGILFFLAWIFIGLIGTDVEVDSRWGVLDRMLTYVPFLGVLQRHARSAQVCEILGVLVSGGNGARESVGIAKEAISSPVMRHALDDVEAALAVGQEYEAKPRRILIPQTTLWMLSETQGSPQLGATLISMADYHRRQLDMLSSITRDIMEPLLLLAVAILGGFGIIAFLSPVMSISNIVF